jgi:hypothetical protein
VGDALRSFEREAKVPLGLRQPAIDGSRRRQMAKGIVHLNRVEPGCVVLQHFLGRSLGRVEVRLPGGISPARTAEPNLAGSRCGRRWSGAPVGVFHLRLNSACGTEELLQLGRLVGVEFADQQILKHLASSGGTQKTGENPKFLQVDP